MAQPRHVARTIDGSCFFCVCVNITTPTFVPVIIPDFRMRLGTGLGRQFDHVSKVNNNVATYVPVTVRAHTQTRSRRSAALQCSVVIAVP